MGPRKTKNAKRIIEECPRPIGERIFLRIILRIYENLGSPRESLTFCAGPEGPELEGKQETENSRQLIQKGKD